MLWKVIEQDGRTGTNYYPPNVLCPTSAPVIHRVFPFRAPLWKELLDLAKEVWDAQPTPLRIMVEHMEMMSERMTAIWPAVRERMEKSQLAQTQVYNRGTQP